MDLPGVGLVYLTKSYKKFIKEFLGENPHFLPGPGDSNFDYSRVEKECRKRQEFLNNYTKITRGHWGKGWYILTQPVAVMIYITRDFKESVVSYQNGSVSRRAYLRKINMKWKLIDTGTW